MRERELGIITLVEEPGEPEDVGDAAEDGAAREASE
jgi:hypothetical protein